MVSEIVRWGIPLMAAALANAFVFGVDRAERALGTPPEARARRVAFAAIGVFTWMGAVGALAIAGVLRYFDWRPPPMLLAMASGPLLAFAVGLSPAGDRLARGLPLMWLVGFQAFRLPLELLMHRALEYGLMPLVMSYSGRNFDIVSGVTALALGVALALAPGRVPLWLVALWNLIGTLLLVNIVVIAVLATPVIRFFGDEQINGWVSRFPYIWMVVMVSAATLGHVLLWRRIVFEMRQRRGAARVSSAT